MNTEGRFRWELLGKPDYSQATAYVASLPEEIRRQLDGTDKELTVRILHLSWLHSVHSGRNAGYCWPRLATLAKYCDRSVRTVGRHLRHLADLGLITWRARKNRDQSWTSNLYQMGKTFIASLFARNWRKSPMNRPMTKMAHNNLKKGIEAAHKKQQASIPASSDVKKRASAPLASPSGLAKGPSAPPQVQTPTSPTTPETPRPSLLDLLGLEKRPTRTSLPTSWEDEDAAAADAAPPDDRRALLKKQAQWLKEHGL